MRVLKWIADRCHGRAEANETSLGWIPESKSFDLEGMDGFDAVRVPTKTLPVKSHPPVDRPQLVPQALAARDPHVLGFHPPWPPPS